MIEIYLDRILCHLQIKNQTVIAPDNLVERVEEKERI